MQTVTDMDGDRVDVSYARPIRRHLGRPYRGGMRAQHGGRPRGYRRDARRASVALPDRAHGGGGAGGSHRGFSAKDLEALKPDVVFADDDDLRKGLKGTNVPVIDVECDTLDELRQSLLRLTGQVLGGEAVDRAKRVIERLDGQAGRVGRRCSRGSAREGPPVGALRHLGVHGRGRRRRGALGGAWTEAAGGRVANADDEDEDETYNVNDLIALNPDVIVTETPAEVEQILNDAAWASVAAVQNQQVYVNPRGLNSWAAPGPEVSLQVAWLASKSVPRLGVGRRGGDLGPGLLPAVLRLRPLGRRVPAHAGGPAAGGRERERAHRGRGRVYAQDEVAKEQADSGNIPPQGTPSTRTCRAWRPRTP